MEEKNSASIKWKIAVSILALLILAMLVWTFVQRSHLMKLIDAREVEKVEMQRELDSLMTEHNTIKEIYGTLSDSLSTKDSIIQANAVEIRKLLDTQYEYYKIRKKMAMLQKVAQGYVHQMDSLYTVNRELKEENERIRQVVRTEQGRNQNLIKDKEELTQKMNQAAVLQAYNVTTAAYKVRGTKSTETDKANRTDKLKICFTIGENSLIEQSTKISLCTYHPPRQCGCHKKQIRCVCIQRPGDPLFCARGYQLHWESDAGLCRLDQTRQ